MRLKRKRRHREPKNTHKLTRIYTYQAHSRDKDDRSDPQIGVEFSLELVIDILIGLARNWRVIPCNWWSWIEWSVMTTIATRLELQLTRSRTCNRAEKLHFEYS